MSSHTPPGSDLSSFTARAIVLVAGLNLNGLLFMLTGRGQLFSPLLLAGALYLCLGFGKRISADGTAAAFGAFTAAYIVLGLFFGSFSGWHYATTYGSSFLLFFGIAAYVSSRRTREEIDAFIAFVRNVLFVSCVSVFFSRELTEVYAEALSSADRNGGFFGNANEAGIVAATTFALVLAAPSRRQWLNVLQMSAALGAVALTFSKSSLLVCGLVLIVHALRRPSLPRLMTAAAVLAAGWLVIGTLSANGVAGLSAYQQNRIGQVSDLLAGTISDHTTTGRSTLWSLAADRIEGNFPSGAGLGRFHHMEGGVMQRNVWMGAHNSYLMAWGEAGLPAFALLLATMLLFMTGALRCVSALPLLYFVILQVDMMSAHNALGLRFHNVLMGLAVGLMAALAREPEIQGPGAS